MSFLGGNNGLSSDIVNNINQVKGIMNGMQNPNNFIRQMFGNNNQISQVMNMCQGKNPKDVFYSMCSQRGVDPQAILDELQK